MRSLRPEDLRRWSLRQARRRQRHWRLREIRERQGQPPGERRLHPELRLVTWRETRLLVGLVPVVAEEAVAAVAAATTPAESA